MLVCLLSLKEDETHEELLVQHLANTYFWTLFSGLMWVVGLRDTHKCGSVLMELKLIWNYTIIFFIEACYSGSLNFPLSDFALCESLVPFSLSVSPFSSSFFSACCRSLLPVCCQRLDHQRTFSTSHRWQGKLNIQEKKKKNKVKKYIKLFYSKTTQCVI